MSLSAGTKLAHYEVLEPIGKGGMGEVYRARDTKLGRDVAIKVLPEEFARDQERLARFEREARLLAQVNHANIATLYGLEEHDGQKFIAMELVEGETLAERIAKGRIAIDEAIPLFIQIAEGLEAAHDKGIVHRDLKPANIKMGPDDNPKILDFGLAKGSVVEDKSAVGSSQSPTLTKGTALGAIIGTASYMSPEQARGKAVDRRTDIWAFGCCLHEALTGKKAFDGDSVTDILAAVVHLEPDTSAIPAEAPDSLLRLLRRSLEKDPRNRLHHIADARLELSEGSRVPHPPSENKRRSVSFMRVAVGLVALVVAGLVGWMLAGRPTSTDRSVERFTINMPGFNFNASGAVAVSPDGRYLAYSSGRRGLGLYLRRFDEWTLSPLSGSEGAQGPFFSPDSRWIAFFVGGEIKKIRLDGGTAETVAATQAGGRGGSWTEESMIYFTQTAGLFRVSAEGGAPELVLPLDQGAGHRRYTWPEALPEGKAVLFTVQHDDRFDSFLYEIESRESRVLVEGATNARYAGSGHLVVSRDGSLEAIPFDLENLEVTGPPRSVVERVAMIGGLAEGFSFSRDGMLVYVTDQEFQRALVLVDREGVETELTQGQASFAKGWLGEPVFSPDGEKLAVTNYTAREGRLCDTLVFDIRRRTLTRLTFDGDNHSPVWTPDGRDIIYNKYQGSRNFYMQRADASRPPEILHAFPENFGTLRPMSWSPDGQILLFRQQDPRTGSDIWALPAGADPEPFAQTPFEERWPQFSPDGKWVAFASDETGRPEVYLRPYPGPGVKLRVPTEGGTHPRWSSTGRELFFRAPVLADVPDERAQTYKMMVVRVDLAKTPQLGETQLLFEDQDYVGPNNYDVSPDGSRFVMVKGRGSTQELHVIRNWFEELKRIAPVDE